MNHRSYVGPEQRWTLCGEHQLSFLTQQGLKPHHTLLDIGCGSLRAGKLFIPYLAKGNYCGIEPNEEALTCGIEKELGTDLLQEKNPTFCVGDDQFPCGYFNRKFDYVIAHSIFIHAATNQIKKCFSEVLPVLRGTFYFTVIFGPDCQREKWSYPETVRHSKEAILEAAEGFNVKLNISCGAVEPHVWCSATVA